MFNSWEVYMNCISFLDFPRNKILFVYLLQKCVELELSRFLWQHPAPVYWILSSGQSFLFSDYSTMSINFLMICIFFCCREMQSVRYAESRFSAKSTDYRNIVSLSNAFSPIFHLIIWIMKRLVIKLRPLLRCFQCCTFCDIFYARMLFIPIMMLQLFLFNSEFNISFPCRYQSIFNSSIFVLYLNRWQI